MNQRFDLNVFGIDRVYVVATISADRGFVTILD